MRRFTVALDFDGTLVEKRWPEIGPTIPGAVEFVRDLVDTGAKVYLFTARTSRKTPWGTDEPLEEVERKRVEVLGWLEDNGLHEVEVWGGNKPAWDVLIDDKVIRFPGSKRAWSNLGPTIVEMAGGFRG